jgi:hypothetical protein
MYYTKPIFLVFAPRPLQGNETHREPGRFCPVGSRLITVYITKSPPKTGGINENDNDQFAPFWVIVIQAFSDS